MMRKKNLNHVFVQHEMRTPKNVVVSEKKGIGESELCSWISEKESEGVSRSGIWRNSKKASEGRRSFVTSQSGDKLADQSLHFLSKTKDQPSQLTRTVIFRRKARQRDARQGSATAKHGNRQRNATAKQGTARHGKGGNARQCSATAKHGKAAQQQSTAT